MHPCNEACLSVTKPVNVFTVNDEYEADHMVYYIKSQLAGRGGGGGDHVIVYANNSSLDVYGCIRTLLNCGVKGERIILARKAMEDNEATCFNNPLVRIHTILPTIRRQKIKCV